MRDFDKYQKNGAYHYKWYDDPNYAWYKECVDRCVEFCIGSTVDAGCGDGLLLSKLKHKAVGIDNEISALKICKDKGLPVWLGDLNEEVLYADVRTWDYVCSLNTIEHLQNPQGLLDLVSQVTKGAIIITDNARHSKGRYHEKEYNKAELIETFKEFDPKYFEINSTEFGEPITFIGVEIKK